MSGLEFIAQTAKEASEISFGDLVNYGKIFAVVVGVGLSLYYIPKWREKWYKQDEEKRNLGAGDLKKEDYSVLQGK